MRKTLLVVDDDINFLRTIGEYLNSKGYETTTVSSPVVALDFFKKTGFHVVLLDQKMPDLDGTVLARKLKEIDDTTKIVILTAYPDVKRAVKLVKEGVIADYLTKPIELADLENTLSHLFNEIKLEIIERVAARGRKFVITTRPTEYLKEVFEFVQIAAKVKSPVMLTGETGTGKNYIAGLIHKMSGRANFVHVNCAAIPESIFEAELFGVEKGAFTGAITKRGMFELADGGTLFLDEVAEMPLPVQAKLLDAVERLKIRRVGGEREIPVDVRLIVATNQPVAELIKKGRFREDLYFRLNVLHFHVKPLRERTDDIEVLAHAFLKEFFGKEIYLKRETIQAMKAYTWPGNIRELKNLIEKSYILSTHTGHSVDEIILSELTNRGKNTMMERKMEEKILPLAELEKRAILHALSVYKGNKSQAAKALGISLSTLKRKLKTYKI